MLYTEISPCSVIMQTIGKNTGTHKQTLCWGWDLGTLNPKWKVSIKSPTHTPSSSGNPWKGRQKECKNQRKWKKKEIQVLYINSNSSHMNIHKDRNRMFRACADWHQDFSVPNMASGLLFLMGFLNEWANGFLFHFSLNFYFRSTFIHISIPPFPSLPILPSTPPTPLTHPLRTTPG